jgi:uncharacterized protein
MTADVIDGDIHAVLPSVETLLPYLDSHWRDYVSESGFAQTHTELTEFSYPSLAPTTGPSGDDAPTLRDVQRHLDTWRAQAAIVCCYYPVEGVSNPDFAAAMASAVNDWLIAEWLDRDERLRGSVLIAPQQPDMAAQEIERVGDHPGVVQVILPARSEAPYGNRRFHPIFAAATRHGLAVRLQFGGVPGVAPTASGWPSYYIEEYVGMASILQTQLTSIIAEGTLERFSDLRIVAGEAGFAWVPAYLWRFDKEWKALRREVPWMKQSPTRYIRDHVRFTLQPVDAPDLSVALGRLADQVGADDMVLFSTDFPHKHDPTPEDAAALLVGSDEGVRVLGKNAREFLKLEIGHHGHH